MPLGARVHVQFGQFEVAAEDVLDLVPTPPRRLHSVADLLLPPLVGGAAIPVGDRDERTGPIGLRRIGTDGTDRSPSRALRVFGPQRRAVELRPAGVVHGFDVDRQGLR